MEMEMEGFPGQEHWSRIKSTIKHELGEEVYSSWFARINLEGHSNNTVKLSVPTLFLKQWIHKNYESVLVKLWKRECVAVKGIELNVRGATISRKKPPKQKKQSEPRCEYIEAKPIALQPIQNSADLQQKPIPIFEPTESEEFEGSQFEAKFTFDTFAVAGSNTMAYAASRQIASSENVNFNPLYIHAGVGLGKTHLLQAIANAVDPNRRKVLYLTAEHFMYRFVAALNNQSAIAFKDRLRNLDLLLIDDMQFLHGKQVQAEFCHTLNTLIDGAKQVVCASDRVPGDLSSLNKRTQSRLMGGLVVEIESTDYQLRRKILVKRCRTFSRTHRKFVIPDEVLDYIAENITTNGRDLEGAMNRLLAHSQFAGEQITMEVAEKSLKDLTNRSEPRQVNIEDIQRIVSKHYSLTRNEMLAYRRSRVVVRPRQIAMYLSKVMTARSLPEIGKLFGNRDHSTVLHAVRKVEKMISSDTSLAKEIELLRQMVNS